MISYNVPQYVADETEYVVDVIRSHNIGGDGDYTKKCNAWLEKSFGATKVYLTTSGTSSLDIALLCCDLKPGDEVILPSFTFSSTANAAVLCGARLVFVDVRPDTMNIDENKIEDAITDRTKAIVVVHYAGVPCEMDTIMQIARKHGLKVVEDAAQGVMSTYKDRYLGTIGDFGCYSFHETKNFSMGEGGAIVVNDDKYIEKVEILREKGTDRSKFYRGQVDKYTWIGFGDSYLPSELNAAYLYPQLLKADEIIAHRRRCWEKYYEGLYTLHEAGKIELPFIPEGCKSNAHIFFIKVRDIEERTALIDHLKEDGIMATFHYVPLHSAPAGLMFGRFHGDDEYTTKESERLLRLPLHCELTEQDCDRICESVIRFWD